MLLAHLLWPQIGCWFAVKSPLTSCVLQPDRLRHSV